MKYTKILLVDDDTDDRQIFEQILQEIDTGIRMDSAGDGLEMIAWLDSCPDQDLPDLVILYSTYQVKDFFRECREQGALDVVSKPDTMQSYREMIHHFFK